MGAAITLAASENGVLVRAPGGYWRTESTQNDQHAPHVGTSTINALITREWVEKIDYKDGKKGKFPIRIQIRAEKLLLRKFLSSFLADMVETISRYKVETP